MKAMCALQHNRESGATVEERTFPRKDRVSDVDLRSCSFSIKDLISICYGSPYTNM